VADPERFEAKLVRWSRCNAIGREQLFTELFWIAYCCERVQHNPTQFAMAVANQYEVGQRTSVTSASFTELELLKFMYLPLYSFFTENEHLFSPKMDR